MNRFCSFRSLPGIALLQVALALGCARPKPAAPPPVDQTTKVCAALGQTKPLEARFVGVLPLYLGGLLVVLGGTTEVELARFLKTLDIRPASVTACGSDALVVLIQGVNKGYMVDNFQRILQSEVPLARIKERVLVHPFIPPDKPRATRN